MVFFCCEGCGASVKKNQVEKHSYQCRGCSHISCMDCNKVFDLESYKAHTKCVTEDQRYASKSVPYVAKDNKGEQKQEAWIEQVQRAIATSNPKNNQLRSLLAKLENYPNIPRKAVKFKNFLKNSLRVHDLRLVDEAWTAISNAAEKQSSAEPPKNGDKNGVKVEQDGPPPAKKLKTITNGTAQVSENGHVPTESTITTASTPATKFKWGSAIKRVLKEQPNRELKVKKLRKRVVNEFLALNGESGGVYKELREKFDEKLMKISKVKVVNSMAKYVPNASSSNDDNEQ